jgi:hypothetical protein
VIYEIRNYHFDPRRVAEYRTWAKTRAIPHLKQHLNVVGFWASIEVPSEVLGGPADPLGSANITWIIAWDDITTRETTLNRIFSSPEWGAIFAHVPGGLASYLRRESKFTESLM